MKKRKIFKKITLGGLAVVMAGAGIFAFAPLSNTAIMPSSFSAGSQSLQNVPGFTTDTGGIITPKADDPVIYTTETGLEIKYGNAVPNTINSSLGSGNLAGFPYFTTQNGSNTYTWVIIGRNADVTNINSAVQSYLFSTWKSNNALSDSWTYGNYFFDISYESITPAGNAIYKDVSSKGVISDNLSLSISGIKDTTEIPSGCVLTLANNPIEKCLFATTTPVSSPDYVFVGKSNPLRILCESYHTNDTFGFGTLKNSLQLTTLKQLGIYYTNSTQYLVEDTTNLHFFPLDRVSYNSFYLDNKLGQYQPWPHNNFVIDTYLNASKIACGYQTWCRSMHYQNNMWYVQTNGNISQFSPSNDNTYVRPACVLKVVD